jgi:hypothetical protein
MKVFSMNLGFTRASVCAVIVMAPGVVAALPPPIVVKMTLLSRLTVAAGSAGASDPLES